MDRIPLVYVLSSGRSGSTLLDLLLGAHDEIWTVGEAQFLPLEIARGAACGCGEPLAACPFWCTVLEGMSLDDAPVPLNYFRLGGHGKVLRWEHLPSLASGYVPWWQRRAVEAYGALNQRVLRRVMEVASERGGRPVRWVVDASKDPYRLLWLERSGRFDIRVLHLLKDPRAFVYSMTRRLSRPSRRRVLRYAARWNVENALGWRLCRHVFGARARLVRYEDLASHPTRIMGRIARWLGRDYDPAWLERFRSVENHAVGGNPMRWSDTPMRLDSKWRTHLRREDARAVWLASTPVRHLVGYW